MVGWVHGEYMVSTWYIETIDASIEALKHYCIEALKLGDGEYMHIETIDASIEALKHWNIQVRLRLLPFKRL